MRQSTADTEAIQGFCGISSSASCQRKCLQHYGYYETRRTAVARRAETPVPARTAQRFGTRRRVSLQVFVINQGEAVGLGELGSAAVELASSLVALIT